MIKTNRMMNKPLLSLAIFSLPLIAHAQVITDGDKVKLSSKDYAANDTSAWTYGGILNIGGNQGLLHNWAAGGELASLTINGIFNGFATYTSGRNVWANNLDLNYGLNYAYSYSFVPRKTDDRIDFTSRYGRKLSDSSDFFFTGLFNFKSQFTKGYDYALPDWQKTPTSHFFSPAYFTLAPGFEYRKGSWLSIFASPLAARVTLVDTQYTNRNPEGAFGVPYGKNSRFEFGAYLSARYMTDPSKKVSFRTRLDLYSNYLAKDVKDSLGNVVREDNPGNIMVLSDNLVSFKCSKHLNISIGLVLIYDNAVPYEDSYVDPMGMVQKKKEPVEGLGWVQIRQNLQFGLEYKFPLPKKTGTAN